MPKFVKDILPIENPEDYKIHFAVRNKDGQQPLDALARCENNENWASWQGYYPGRDAWKEERYIFALAKFYHEDDTWLFGGVFEVLDLIQDEGEYKYYKVRRTSIGEEFIRRLKIRAPSHKAPRQVRRFMEPHYSKSETPLEVAEILNEPYEPYSVRPFPGASSLINMSFGELETIINKKNPDWMEAMKNIKGVYLITDTLEQKRYVGASWSESEGKGGLWARWAEYIESGHGYLSEGLKEKFAYFSKEGILEYCREYFFFTLLEQCSGGQSDVQAREGFWKAIIHPEWNKK